MDGIVEENLKLMQTRGKGTLCDLFQFESVGSSGGTWLAPNGALYTCMTANFCYDSSTGKILYFDNPQYLPKDCIGAVGSFRISAMGQFQDTEYQDQILDICLENPTEVAAKTIQKTVEIYNTKRVQ